MGAAITKPSRKPRPAVWLDELPDDVCDRITKFLGVKKGMRHLCQQVLSLALVSDKQTQTVLRAMEYTIDLALIQAMTPASASAWCSLTSPYVRHLHVTEIEKPHHRKYRDIFLKTSPLESLYAPRDLAILKSLRHQPALRVLHLRFSSKHPPLASNTRLLFRTLYTLDLTELLLDCQVFAIDSTDANDVGADVVCGFQQLLRYDPDPAALGRCCPNVEKLCLSCHHSADWSPLPHLLDGFPSLREFTPDFRSESETRKRDISDAVVAKLQSLDSVHLCHFDQAYPRAIDIGASIKTLVWNKGEHQLLHNSEQLEKLSRCPKLVHLCVAVTPGVETALPHLSHNLYDLQTLSFDWETDAHMEATQFVASAYYSPAPLPLLRSVQQLPALTYLALTSVKLPILDLVSLLKTMGNRLQAFITSIRGQDEPPEERLAVLMEEIRRSNRDMYRFGLYDADRVEEDELRHSREGNPSEVNEQRLQDAFGQLRKKCPSLLWTVLVEHALLFYKLKLMPGLDEQYLMLHPRDA